LAALARRDRQAADRLLARGGDSATLRRLAHASRDRGAALHLMTALRRAATPAGLLPERVDAHTGLPTSTTPLGWSHAFAILALRELWPQRIRH
jgi:GH15 family glucan-1,4-alpha-glucosidase